MCVCVYAFINIYEYIHIYLSKNRHTIFSKIKLYVIPFIQENSSNSYAELDKLKKVRAICSLYII